MTVTPAPKLPCQEGMNCKSPTTCSHKLHTEDFFEPYTDGLTDDEAATALAAYKPVEAKALWACKLDCPMRSQCLDLGMQEGPTLAYGIYGGYTSAQRRAITRDIAKRAEQGLREGGRGAQPV